MTSQSLGTSLASLNDGLNYQTTKHVFEPFDELIIAYTACRNSMENVERLGDARTEAELLHTVIDKIVKDIRDRETELESDQAMGKLPASNYTAMYLWVLAQLMQARLNQGGKFTERMRRPIRRLRMLSLDDIDPILNDPSSIGKPWSSSSAETKAQRIARTLKEAYDEFMGAYDEMYKNQVNEREQSTIQKNRASTAGPERCCQCQVS